MSKGGSSWCGRGLQQPERAAKTDSQGGWCMLYGRMLRPAPCSKLTLAELGQQRELQQPAGAPVLQQGSCVGPWSCKQASCMSCRKLSFVCGCPSQP